MTGKDGLRDKLKDLLDAPVLERGLLLLGSHVDPIKQLLEQRAVPATGWQASQVRLLFSLLAAMDTDKDVDAARVGEREGRTGSEYVLSLAEGFAHGIGRSGDIAAIQPKAPGGSILNRLSARLATSMLRGVGLPAVEESIVLPVATGMTIALCMGAIHRARAAATPGAPWARDEVIVPRVDHDSPRKGIELAGFKVVEVPSRLHGDAVEVPVESVQEQVSNRTAAILSTTAFFPPRAPDKIKDIARLCKDLNIPHVVNNSYGIQSEAYSKLLRGAMDAGRVDYIIQSTDKNFLTPVGGAIACSPVKGKIKELARGYAGRASAQPLVQFVASVLSTGMDGYKALMADQRRHREMLEREAGRIAGEHGQRLLDVDNPIAVAMTTTGLPASIGGILYNLRVTGPRVVMPGERGSCIDTYPHPYMTLNAGIGARDADIEALARKLEAMFTQAGRQGA